MAVALIGACSSKAATPASSVDGPTTTAGHPVPAQIMAQVGTTVLAPAYHQLAVAANELQAATTACDLDRSKAAWRATRLAYGRAFAGNGFSPMALRRLLGTIDFWPTDATRIEALVNGTDRLAVDAINALGARLRGLPGIEVVLFGAGPFPGRRCQLATVQSTILQQAAEMADTQWAALAPTLEANPTVLGSFVSSLVSTVSLVEGVQLGVPAGLRQGLPASVKNVRGGNALEDAAAALAGSAVAIDAGVVPLVSPDLGGRLQDAMKKAEAAVAAIPGPLSEAITTSVPVIEAAVKAIKVAEVLLTTEVVGSLGLTLSFPADGD